MNHDILNDLTGQALRTAEQHRGLVVGYNRTEAPYPSTRTVVELFEEQVDRTPGVEAVRHGDVRLTYEELDARGNQLAHYLRTQGVQQGDVVVLLLEHSAEVLCAVLGVLKAGAAYAPVDPDTPAERLHAILDDLAQGSGGQQPLVLTQQSLRAHVRDDWSRLFLLDDNAVTAWSLPSARPSVTVSPSSLAYIIYTSGSTGTPKGVMIAHQSLTNYIWWASRQYCKGERTTWPLFSSLAFDLTVTSLFTPLVSGGRIVVYNEDAGRRSLVIFRVIEDGIADVVKLTPSHLAMIADKNLSATSIRRLVVGGEDLKTELARRVTERFGRPVEIYNEYGPTEATVGCMIHAYDGAADVSPSVPIGTPAANAQIYILDESRSPVGVGVIGEMYIGGDGLALGYFNRPELTHAAFVAAPDPRNAWPDGVRDSATVRLYKTGDMARWTRSGRMEFLGRADGQVKIGGFRIELGDIEARLLTHPAIRVCVAAVVTPELPRAPQALSAPVHCTRCGLASNFPGATFDEAGVCNVCRAYESYKDRAEVYFRTPEDLKKVIAEMQASRVGDYDCVVLLSGGKDSTYMLYQLCALGVRPLVFTLDNGFISDDAKENIRRIVRQLGVDLVFGTTPHMNEIFVDSLNTYANVCNGCFKTIYTLATSLAKEKGIRYVVTGLSRGQFFETRLTEEVFRRKDFDVDRLDALVLEARRAYHQREDAVSSNLDGDLFRDESIFEDIQFVDFYRYWSVSLEDMYAFIETHAAWLRPSDTGRSTNCLINDLGIYVHKKQRGYHNYSLPYSWDVRLHQKTRAEAMEELDDQIDEERVREMMAKIGYVEPPRRSEHGERLAAYYVSDEPVPAAELRSHLAAALPDYMVPGLFVRLDRIPVTANGKVDRKALPPPVVEDKSSQDPDGQPRTETERVLASMWSELLNVPQIGIRDEFFELGGHSLLAIRAVSRIRDLLDVDVPLEVMFTSPTVESLGMAVDELRLKAVDGAKRRTPIVRRARRSGGTQ